MNETDERIANHIKEMGDLSAHLGQRVDEDRIQHALYSSYRLWVGEDESWELLNSTAKLVVDLANR